MQADQWPAGSRPINAEPLIHRDKVTQRASSIMWDRTKQNKGQYGEISAVSRVVSVTPSVRYAVNAKIASSINIDGLWPNACLISMFGSSGPGSLQNAKFPHGQTDIQCNNVTIGSCCGPRKLQAGQGRPITMLVSLPVELGHCWALVAAAVTARRRRALRRLGGGGRRQGWLETVLLSASCAGEGLIVGRGSPGLGCSGWEGE